MSKIKELTSRGLRVTLIVCYDDYNPYKNLRSEIDEDQHFLFCDLKNQLVNERNVTLEFIYVWDVLHVLPQLIQDNVNLFLLDFTINDRSDEQKILHYIDCFSFSKVSIELVSSGNDGAIYPFFAIAFGNCASYHFSLPSPSDIFTTFVDCWIRCWEM